MNRGHLISAVVLLSALAVAGAFAAPAAVGTATAQETNASITYNDQQATDNVTVESATLPEGGFVVIYNSSGGVIGNTSALESGTHENLTVNVSPPFSTSGVSIGELHRDNDSDGTFNETVDTAYNTSSGGAVSSTAFITVESNGTTTTSGETTTTAATETTDTAGEPDGTETVETTTGETTTGDGTGGEGTETTGPGFTLVGALVALVATALLARRT